MTYQLLVLQLDPSRRDYRLILKSSEKVSPVILHKRFFEAVVETHCVRDEWASYTCGHLILRSNENDIPAACFPTQSKPPGWSGDRG